MDKNNMSQNNHQDTKETPESMTFYYSREERLKRMPEHQKLYNGELIAKSGFFKVLVATPGAKFLFISVLFLSAIVVIFTLTGTAKNTAIIAEIPAKIEAFPFEDTLYVTITLAENVNFSQKKELTAEIGIYDNEKRLQNTTKLTAEYDGTKQLLRTTFTNYEIFSIIAIIRCEEESQSLTVNVSY